MVTETASDPPTAHDQRRRDPGRLLTFSDGVFAVIITILVLDLQPPDLSGGVAFKEALREVRPTFVAMVVSFLLVGMFWTIHRALFIGVRYTDHNVTWLNLLFLLALSLVPFAAATLGEHSGEATALHLYGITVVAIGFMRLVLNEYLLRALHLRWETLTPEARRMSRILAMAPLGLYAVATLLAGVSPSLSLLLFVTVPVLYFVLLTVLSNDHRTRAAVEEVT